MPRKRGLVLNLSNFMRFFSALERLFEHFRRFSWEQKKSFKKGLFPNSDFSSTEYFFHLSYPYIWGWLFFKFLSSAYKWSVDMTRETKTFCFRLLVYILCICKFFFAWIIKQLINRNNLKWNSYCWALGTFAFGFIEKNFNLKHQGVVHKCCHT